jgi:vesicular inhibitory amino acid transporter
MDIPNSSKGDSNVPRIRNLHPSQLSPQNTHSYGATFQDELPTGEHGGSFTERLGSFVGSYSRTSLMFMAENLAVPNGPMVTEIALQKKKSYLIKIF